MIGPHEGKELELMLSGKKPMAKFTKEPTFDPDTSAFDPYVESGKLLLTTINGNRGCVHRYYCLPGEEWRVRLSLFIFHQADWNMTASDLHKLDGFLLGYDKDSVDEFIEHCKKSDHESKKAGSAP